MHELAIAEGILSVVHDVAQGQPVRRVRVRVGSIHAVVPESLQFSFQLAAEDTCAAPALLEIVAVPAWLRCRTCGAESRFDGASFPCPSCRASDIEITSGQELLVEAVELERGDVIVNPSGRETPGTRLQEHAAAGHDHRDPSIRSSARPSDPGTVGGRDAASREHDAPAPECERSRSPRRADGEPGRAGEPAHP